jgi:uncharacterized protein
MKRLMIILFAMVFGGVSVVMAQGHYPERENPYINDYRDLLATDSEFKIMRWLEELNSQHDIEMTVVTIDRVSTYRSGQTLEAFATGLFNRWGVGSLPANRGVLILVARDDRQVRIELGEGYDSSYDRRAQGVIDEFMLPAFRDNDYVEGIENGVRGMVNTLTGNWPTGAAPTFFEQLGFFINNLIRQLGWFCLLIPGGILAAVGGFWWYRESRRCPQCGQITLSVSSTVLEHATTYSTGEREVHKDCYNCGYSTTYTETIARRSSSNGSSGGSGGSSGSSGVGSSRGGGASGSW